MLCSSIAVLMRVEKIDGVVLTDNGCGGTEPSWASADDDDVVNGSHRGSVGMFDYFRVG